MDPSERIKMTRIIGKMEKNKKYAEKLGMINKSVYAFRKELKEEEK